MHANLLFTLTPGRTATDIGHSLRESLSMFADTFWALVLGFALSGAVQAFASRDAMQRRLGDHGPKAVGRATVYGMISSSCSYAASAMARSLFVKGADFLAAMVFMVASTNLVVELGIVLVVLIGWQFVAAEFVGGLVMIGLLVLTGSLWFRGRALEEATSVAAGHGGGHHHHGPDDEGVQRQPLRTRLRSAAGWADAASYTMSDLEMIRREVAVGFVVAGFGAVLIPTSAWNALFLHGHGFWTSLENVVVGPFVAVVSFVCSIGNVPLAAALWKGGISFGGVVSFIFADLITLPLLLIYRTQYGRRMSVRMLAVFWGVMSLTGLVTEYLFKALGWVPHTRPTVIASDALRWDTTTALDVVALIAFAGLYWLHRNRERFGGGTGYAKDPVCGMQVETANAPASVEHHGTVYFCSERCRDRFVTHPERYVDSQPPVEAGSLIDPVCGMNVDPDHAAAHRDRHGREYFFCGPGCADAFDADPGAGLDGVARG